MRLKTTLDQWLTLFEIDKAGSIQAAAATLNKSHTTLIYSVRKLEDQLGVPLLKVEGRRSILTDDGKSLLRRAQSMLEQAKALEEISTQLAQGTESELTVAIDHLCDRRWLYAPMAEFFKQNHTTSIQVVETSLSKTQEMVTNESADISIITLPITNHPSETFGMASMLPVVAKSHPLAEKLNPCLADLSATRQIVIRDLGHHAKQDVGWLKSNQRITVDNFDHAWQATKQGLGYCRLPRHIIEKHNDNDIKILRVEHSNQYQVPLHLTLPKGAKTGPAAQELYQLMLASASHRS
ncbi:LysR family transcriptional regulator [Shewanella sp. Choline-02u-19]|uniref:LysR family transcriptional regulator n=1 Tax=unclassified Shewanella TaxID=196818 RepID=UPI000C3286DE|nr:MULTISPECIES: LysR family transcriptional regulator [unclassified Shewanella]PKG58383.1 LysR family transcriptional regulator [Shewanella sp. GutDb-MelDb]PKG73345.1 LysR family transcriptional regulator [Shewanella sp. GutCb]PKH59187.1 LysR family transcriptional regulator [Shewanella sp. Bg11-22]PKI27062.1 LysR family transcriptional regulator [Shewanella sp. Choline-02u-19]